MFVEMTDTIIKIATLKKIIRLLTIYCKILTKNFWIFSFLYFFFFSKKPFFNEKNIPVKNGRKRVILFELQVFKDY